MTYTVELPLPPEVLVHRENADPMHRSSALRRLAAEGHRELIPLARQWLEHENDTLRRAALIALIYTWRCDSDVDAALRLLERDPNSMARWVAADVLQDYALETGKRRDEILRALVRRLELDPDRTSAESYYLFALHLIDPERAKQLQDRGIVDDDGNFIKADVDWELLAPWREPWESEEAREAARAEAAAVIERAREQQGARRRERDLAVIRDDEAGIQLRKDAFGRLAADAHRYDGFDPLRAVAEAWRAGGEPALRGYAVFNLLNYDGSDDDVEAGLRVLREDPEPQVRRYAASGLENYISNRLAFEDLGLDEEGHIDDVMARRILAALRRQLDEDPEPRVQHACYAALLHLTVPRPERPDSPEPEDFDRDRDVDRVLLARWRERPDCLVPRE